MTLSGVLGYAHVKFHIKGSFSTPESYFILPSSHFLITPIYIDSPKAAKVKREMRILQLVTQLGHEAPQCVEPNLELMLVICAQGLNLFLKWTTITGILLGEISDSGLNLESFV